MKIKYEPAGTHYVIRCNETHEEKDFLNEEACLIWARKVVHTFQEEMTFTLIRVTDASTDVWVNKDLEIGIVR